MPVKENLNLVKDEIVKLKIETGRNSKKVHNNEFYSLNFFKNEL